MTIEEQRLSEWLQESTPEPPRAVTVEDVAAAVHRSPAAPRSRRLRSVVLPLVAAACAAGLAIGLAVGLSDDHHAAPATRSSTPNKPSITSTPPSPHPPNVTTLPWPARLIARLQVAPNSLFASGGQLYGLVTGQPSAQPDLVRLDPATGAIVKSATSVIPAVPPVAANGLIWVYDLVRSAIVGLDPISFAPRITSRPKVSAEAGFLLVAAPASHLLLLGNGRHVFEIDTRNGAVLRRLTVDGDVQGLAMRPGGTSFYVSTGDVTGGQLEVVDSISGAVLAGPVSTDELIGLVATAHGLWATATGGHAARVRYVPSAALGEPKPVGGESGGGLAIVPTLSAGVLWATGADLTCADPQTGRVRASSQPKSASPAGYVSGVTVVGHTVYAIFTDFEKPSESGLITLEPPAACGLK